MAGQARPTALLIYLVLTQCVLVYIYDAIPLCVSDLAWIALTKNIKQSICQSARMGFDNEGINKLK